MYNNGNVVNMQGLQKGETVMFKKKSLLIALFLLFNCSITFAAEIDADILRRIDDISGSLSRTKLDPLKALEESKLNEIDIVDNYSELFAESLNNEGKVATELVEIDGKVYLR